MSAVGSHPGFHAPRRAKGRALTIVGVALVIVSALAVAYLAWHRRATERRDAEARARAADRGPVVMVAKVENAAAERDLTLPADVRALYQTTLYAKVSGYVKEVRVDKGQAVRAGQVLGILEAPDVDQAVAAARSDLVLREQEFARARKLAPAVVSQQELDAARTNLEVARANLTRARATQGYETIRAPFDGVVTMRYVDPGALLPAATGATQAAQPFVDVADPARLRVGVYVGQDAASFVAVGDPVTLWEDEHPERRVRASITRTAGALDPRTRTMLCEIEIDGREAHFLPGTFSHVTLHVAAPPLPVIPAEALFLRNGDPLVAVVRDGSVHFTHVTAGVGNGRTMQIQSGLRAGDVVALNLPADVRDGAPVQVVERPAAPPPGPGERR